MFRRQIHLPFRKPLIIATPKSLLRLPACRSPFKDMAEGTEFLRLIADPMEHEAQSVSRIVFCTGKTYYELVEARKERGADCSVVLCRVEQVSIQ